ncbi:twin-arginine translocation pathway signal protein [Hydrogenophaga sp. 5NK40-0174]|uniref:Acg family FMN-binding oxidoreductase n=1 Tax=Hydrogenophaga sp. 5NK40-0174 TaxID=3127649 RepID=UPI0031024D95
MNRRQILRVLGGGTIVAAVAPMAACSSDMPAEAVAAWVPAPFNGDLRRYVLSHAILAPHSHNLQSWIVDLSEPDTIVLHLDLTRLLPQTDPFGRQMVMSQGTFVELLDMAAREQGHRADVEVFPAGEFDASGPDSRPTARIRLVQDDTVRPDPLFAHIFNRRTNREAYEATPPSATAMERIRGATAGLPIATGFTDPANSAQLQAHRQIAKDAWKIEVTTPRTLLESYRLMRVGPTEIAEHRDGISNNEPMLRALSGLGLFDRSQAPDPDSYAVKSQLDDFNSKMDATPGFYWMVTKDNTRSTQFMAGRAYVRAQLAATATGLSMQPLQQALQEYPEQKGPFNAMRDLLGLRQPSHTIQMWTRLGKGPIIGPAPRRGVDAHVQRT